MRHIRLLALMGTIGMLAACSAARVPITGAPADLTALTGHWYGTYSNPEAGRGGSILFQLDAGADSASGDVIMLPRERDWSPAPGTVQSSFQELRESELVLSISWVAVEHGQVRGRLDPYRDPNCGCLITTVFTGHIDGDTIRGTFTSRHRESDRTTTGTWLVERDR